MRIYNVNEQGLDQISKILKQYHKDGVGLSKSKPHLYAWAGDIEQSLDKDGPAMLEIDSHYTLSGHTETHYISDTGIDIEEIEED